MSHCPHCKQPLFAQCPAVGCTAHSRRIEWRQAATGLRYEVRRCEAGHVFVMTTAGRTARRYSRQLEEGAAAAPVPPTAASPAPAKAGV